MKHKHRMRFMHRSIPNGLNYIFYCGQCDNQWAVVVRRFWSGTELGG